MFSKCVQSCFVIKLLLHFNRISNLQVPGKRFTYKFICDLKALIGFTPSDIQRLVVSPTVHIEAPMDADLDTDRARLEQLRETLRVPGIMKRTSAQHNSYEQEGQVLIIDGTS